MTHLRSSICAAVFIAGALTGCGGAGGISPAGSPTVAYARQSAGILAAGGAASGAALMYFSTGSAINVYEQAGTHQSPIRTITTGLSGPSGMYVDGMGDLYVTNAHAGTIAVFHRGQSSPYKTLTGLDETGGYRNDVTTDKRGTVYAVQQQSKLVYVYANGSTTPTSTLKTLGIASEVATDSKGDLFVESFDGGVEEFAAGDKKPKKLPARTFSDGGLAVDGSDDLIVCALGGEDGFGGEISIYAPPYTGQPLFQVGFFNGVYGCAVNRVTGNVWAATSGNQTFAERFNLHLKANDQILVPNAAAGGIAVESAHL